MPVGEQEGAQRTTVRVELLGLVPQAQKDLLHQLLGPLGIAQEPARQPEHGAAVAAIRLSQRVFVITADRDHEGGIGCGGEVGGRHGLRGFYGVVRHPG